MTRVDLQSAIAMLPRWHTALRWHPAGSKCMTNAKVLPRAVEKLIVKLMRKMSDSGYTRVATVKLVDVTGPNIWVLHASLRMASLAYLSKRNWTWNKWPRSKLPVYIQFRGKTIIWNGTHRMTLSRLCKRRVRAVVVDFDAYKKWIKEKHE